MHLSGLRSCQCRLGTAKITLFSTNSEPRFIRILFSALPELQNHIIREYRASSQPTYDSILTWQSSKRTRRGKGGKAKYRKKKHTQHQNVHSNNLSSRYSCFSPQPSPSYHHKPSSCRTWVSSPSWLFNMDRACAAQLLPPHIARVKVLDSACYIVCGSRRC